MEQVLSYRSHFSKHNTMECTLSHPILFFKQDAMEHVLMLLYSVL